MGRECPFQERIDHEMGWAHPQTLLSTWQRYLFEI
jgi:hypothetical protein